METETGKTPEPPAPSPGESITATANDGKQPAQTFASPPAYFAEALTDAESLLKYAAESGISVDDATRDHVLQARAAASTGWNEETAANLITALTKLAALVKPVTAASLQACSTETAHAVRSYVVWAICLAVLIVPFSVASFVASALSSALRADISTANDLAVKLALQLESPPSTSQPLASSPKAVSPSATAKATVSEYQLCAPPSPNPPAIPPPAGVNLNDVVPELQLYASTIRSIDGRARQLNWFVFRVGRDPCGQSRNDPVRLHEVFELPTDLPNHLVQALDDRTVIYQDVRYFAQNLLDDVSFWYGAITTCILPVLYALLGTCAYLMRGFEQQMKARTFTPSAANSARFLIAAIGGAVVGLFNNLTITQGASIPPLALAFLVGYAVDVFFAFLEGLLKTFTHNASVSPPTEPSNANPA